MLLVSCGLGALACLHVVATKEVEQGSVLQSHSLVRFTFVIDQQRKLDAGFLPEKPGVLLVPQTDGGQTGAFLAEFVFKFAQLRDVLPAENSTIMPQKPQHRRMLRPQ